MLLTFGVGCAAQSASTPAPLFDAPESLPGWMRPIVRSQMARQWDQLNELRWTAASLEFERTRQLARGIAGEVHCGRPADDSVSLYEVIPARYLQLQDDLGYRAQQLAHVAVTGDQRLIVHAYDGVVEACTRCHTLYRSGPPLALPTLR